MHEKTDYFPVVVTLDSMIHVTTNDDDNENDN